MGSLVTNILFMPPKIAHEDDQDTRGDALLTTPHKSQIQIKTYIKNKKYLYLLVSHGNAEDIHMVYDWVTKYLINFVNVNVIMYEYTGYGLNQTFTCSE